MKVSSSILAAPLAALAENLKKLDPTLVDLIHLDIMDGHFVPQLTFGENVSKSIHEASMIPLDVHLMVSNPEKEAPKYFSLKPHNITFHYEATSLPIRLAEEIRKAGILAGISLNPSTPVSVLKDILPFFDLVLLMTVEPGFAGQSFLSSGFSRIEELMELKARNNHSFLIEIDGGVNDQNITKLRELSVDIVVSGAFIFNADNPNKQAFSLKGNLDKRKR